MINSEIASGVVHELPTDLLSQLKADKVLLNKWQNLTPLGRNEWICWIESAKKAETRIKRINRTISEIKNGKRRPCCWLGCPHREKAG
ncbi:YdeI/OmpD-associated family protein [Shewanella algae]|uniref:YdeI/OmpD-associated family protein n=1 Tax=Shewanella algae TaxID=38313 RepID=A0A7T8EDL9_9GAMM|nr:hypothetical protein D7032_15275 [Shewanella algae]